MDAYVVLSNLKKHFDLSPKSKILVVGLGSTGLSAVKFLHRLGLSVAVVDSRNMPPSIGELTQDLPDVPVFCGSFNHTVWDVATHLVVSPGVSLRESVVYQAMMSGTKVVSDIDIFACATDKPIIAITGSNGKSTVTTMLGAMGNEAGIKTAIGGNLGTPALDLLTDEAELYVLELSSFQLERTSVLNAAAATVLNLSADHLDRHDDMAAYAKEKQRIFRGNGVMVLNADDSTVMAMQEAGRNSLTFTVQGDSGFHLAMRDDCEWLMNEAQALMPCSALRLEGLHNIANALAALALGTAVGLDVEAMCYALKKFKALAHRMQKVSDAGGIHWVNDSKATNIGACVAALQGYRNKVVLIAGGEGKGQDMGELQSVVKEKAKAVVLMGKDAGLIAQALNGCVPVHFAGTMLDAVKTAAKLAQIGDTVLLSPACASLDQYKNYMERGNKFAEAVRELSL